MAMRPLPKLRLGREQSRKAKSSISLSDKAVLAPGLIEEEVVEPIGPSRREWRAEAFQRLQIGIFGLLGTLMLVALFNIIMNNSDLTGGPSEQQSTSAAANGTAQAGTDSDTNNEPLSDIGVVPVLPDSQVDAQKLGAQGAIGAGGKGHLTGTGGTAGSSEGSSRAVINTAIAPRPARMPSGTAQQAEPSSLNDQSGEPSQP